PRFKRRRPVVDRIPIADDDAVKAPLAAKYVRQQKLVLGGERAVDAVVGRHHHRRLALFDGDLERFEIDLAQRALVYDGVDRVAERLLIVDREVLDARSDAVALYAADE